MYSDSKIYNKHFILSNLIFRLIRSRITATVDKSIDSKTPYSLLLYVNTDSERGPIEVISPPSISGFHLEIHDPNESTYQFRANVTSGSPLFHSHLTVHSSPEKLTETVLRNLYIYRDSNTNQTLFVVANNPNQPVDRWANFMVWQLFFTGSVQLEFEIETGGGEIDVPEFEVELERFKKEFDSR